jgi:hypothetical protein
VRKDFDVVLDRVGSHGGGNAPAAANRIIDQVLARASADGSVLLDGEKHRVVAAKGPAKQPGR